MWERSTSPPFRARLLPPAHERGRRSRRHACDPLRRAPREEQREEGPALLLRRRHDAYRRRRFLRRRRKRLWLGYRRCPSRGLSLLFPLAIASRLHRLEARACLQQLSEQTGGRKKQQQRRAPLRRTHHSGRAGQQLDNGDESARASELAPHPLLSTPRLRLHLRPPLLRRRPAEAPVGTSLRALRRAPSRRRRWRWEEEEDSERHRSATAKNLPLRRRPPLLLSPLLLLLLRQPAPPSTKTSSTSSSPRAGPCSSAACPTPRPSFARCRFR